MPSHVAKSIGGNNVIIGSDISPGLSVLHSMSADNEFQGILYTPPVASAHTHTYTQRPEKSSVNPIETLAQRIVGNDKNR